MKANELRIGNYVNWINTQEPYSLFQIEEIKELNYFDCFVPIPLTEEWLIKFGFAKEKENYTWFYKDNFIINHFDFKAYKLNANRDMLGNSFKYVHQLQNLYFALYGKELEIKK